MSSEKTRVNQFLKAALHSPKKFFDKCEISVDFGPNALYNFLRINIFYR